MNKRLVALVLTLVLTLGVALPALAEEPVTPPTLGIDGVINEDPTAPAETDAALDELAKQAIDPALKEEIQERILIIKDLRAQGEALTLAMKAQHETNQRLWQLITVDVAPLRDQAQQLRDEYKAWVDEQIQPLKAELKSLQSQFVEARQNKDVEAAKAIKAQMQDLRARLQAAAEPIQARRDELKTLVADLKARKEALLPRIDELKALREESKAIYDEIVGLRDQKAAAWQTVRAARDSKDAEGVIAGLNEVISLKKQILADRDQRLSIARQVGTILAAIN